MKTYIIIISHYKVYVNIYIVNIFFFFGRVLAPLRGASREIFVHLEPRQQHAIFPVLVTSGVVVGKVCAANF